MEFILEVILWIDAFPAFARIAWITALDDEARNEPVEDGVAVVAIETMLKKGAGGKRGLLGEEFECEGPGGGVEEEFGRGRGFEVVERGHRERR